MTEAEQKHLDKVETALRITWGAMLAARLMVPDNKYIVAAFAKADAECRKTGLMAREGVVFIEQPASEPHL